MFKKSTWVRVGLENILNALVRVGLENILNDERKYFSCVY